MKTHNLSDHPSWRLGAGFYRAIQKENARRYSEKLLDKKWKGTMAIRWLSSEHIKGFYMGHFFVGRYSDRHVVAAGLFCFDKDYKESKRFGYFSVKQ